jgi:hypothetical protein
MVTVNVNTTIEETPKGLYVRVGPFRDRSEAAEVAAGIRAERAEAAQQVRETVYSRFREGFRP